MRNLGPRMEEMLAEVGITTPAALKRIGAVEAWHRLRFRYGSRITITALNAMAGALIDCDWRALPDSLKQELRKESGS